VSLDVYLSGKRIGALHPGGREALLPNGSDGCTFAYSLAAVEEAPGAPLLSYSLPVRSEPYGPEDTRPYIEGLLPQGERRTAIADELEIDPANGYDLIAALGRDCPGAVTFLPKGSLEELGDPDSLVWLDEDELEELIGEEEPEAFFDPACEQRMRFALPGERHKLALVRDEQEDRWAWPSAGVPSTHIVKPESDEQPGFAVNEMACTMALREMGLPVAHTELVTIAGRRCLVSKRFDRWGDGPGAERLHQESLSQALGYGPYDAEGKGPGYAESRALLAAVGEQGTAEALFTLAYSKFLIGCRDSVHGKSSGLLYMPEGPLLAPFHDIVSTSVYEDPHELISLEEMVHRHSCLVGLTQVSIECEYVLQSALIMAVETNSGVCHALNVIGDRAREEGWYEPVIDEVLQRVIDCLKSFREEIEMLKPPEEQLDGLSGGDDPPEPEGEPA
jgi:HipA-like protein